jgi:carotenoid cleavage dioxygenase-like enzyme
MRILLLLSLSLSASSFVPRVSPSRSSHLTAFFVDSEVPVETKPKTTPEERAVKAKETWSTIALQPTENQVTELCLDDISTVYDQALFDEFKAIKGSYFINGLASCQLGDRLIHPFEAHGYCKSLVFDGQGQLRFTSRLVETALNKREAQSNRITARGVMSTQADFNFIGMLQNAFSPTERDTANLVANLWPPPGAAGDSSTMEPLLITCTDNGDPHVLDPKTLITKGKLVDVVPKLAELFQGRKCLAHTRYDETRQRLIMCINEMNIPGENMKGNSTFEFLEFDINFDLVSSRSFTTRFMVAHE